MRKLKLIFVIILLEFFLALLILVNHKVNDSALIVFSFNSANITVPPSPAPLYSPLSVILPVYVHW